MLKHIIWDWNGTLVDDRWLCIEGINCSLKKRGLSEITDDVYKDMFTFPVEHYYKKVGFDFTNEPFRVAGDEFVSYYQKNFSKVKLHEGALNTIKIIGREGLEQSVLSAGKNEYLVDWIKEHQLFDFFNKIRGINNHYAKGKLALGKKLVEELEHDREEIIMVGDTIHDSDVARAMDIECILVEHGHVSKDRLLKTSRKVVSDFEELLKELF